jgi:hypothetical protein
MKPIPADDARPKALGHTPATRPIPATGQAGPLYRSSGILVTYDVFVVGDRQFTVSRLRGLRVARCEANPIGWWMIVLSGTVLAAVGVALSFGRYPSGPGPVTYAALVLAALAPAVVGLNARRRARRSHELWGEYLGETQLLYSSTDERAFGQVTRALLRAHETARS